MLKLLSQTDPAWAARITEDFDEVLLAHAHCNCEKKAAGVLHLCGKATGKLTLGLDGHIFSRPEATPTGVEGYAGAEVDVIAKLALGKGLALSGVYGLFLPTDEYPADDPSHYVEAQLGDPLGATQEPDGYLAAS